MKKLTQKQKIVKILSDRKWHAITDFYKAFITQPHCLLWDLRCKGYEIAKRWTRKNGIRLKEHKLVKQPPRKSVFYKLYH